VTHKHDDMVEPEKQVAQDRKVESYRPGPVSLLVANSKVEEHRYEDSKVSNDDTASPYQCGLRNPCPGRMASSKEYRLDNGQHNADIGVSRGSYMVPHEIPRQRGQLLGAGEKRCSRIWHRGRCSEDKERVIVLERLGNFEEEHGY
jgi:hypothetical protein